MALDYYGFFYTEIFTIYLSKTLHKQSTLYDNLQYAFQFYIRAAYLSYKESGTVSQTSNGVCLATLLGARPLRLLTSQQYIIFNQNYSYAYELIDQIRAQRSCPLASARTVTRTS